MEFAAKGASGIGGEVTFKPSPGLEKSLATLEELSPRVFTEARKIIEGALEGILLGTEGARNTMGALEVFAAVTDTVRPFVLRAIVRLSQLQREQGAPAPATIPPGIADSLLGVDFSLEDPQRGP